VKAPVWNVIGNQTTQLPVRLMERLLTFKVKGRIET
jgi:hypothetical protein